MFPHNLVKTIGFHTKFVINFAADHSKDLLVALFSDSICLPEYQLCLSVSTLAEKEFLGFTICRHSSGQLTSMNLNILSWQNQPRTMFTFINLHLYHHLHRGKKSHFPIATSSLGERLIFPELRLLKVSWIANLLLVWQSHSKITGKMQRWQPITTTDHILFFLHWHPPPT